MSEEKYNLVFKGQLAKGVDLDVAVRNLAQLFKIDPAKAKALFGGKATILKKGLDMATANKYRVAIKKAGAVVELQPVEEAQVPATQAPPESSSPDHAPASDETTSAFTTSAGVFGAPRPEAANVAVPDFEVAPAGEDLLAEAERTVQNPAILEIDVSGLSVKTDDGNLLNEDEYDAFVPLPLAEPAYDVAPAGADVLKPEERKKEEAVAVDTSDLSLAEAGENLAPAKPAAPPPPDTSNISLAD